MGKLLLNIIQLFKIAYYSAVSGQSLVAKELNEILMESIWLGNNGEALSENLLENFLASTSRSR